MVSVGTDFYGGIMDTLNTAQVSSQVTDSIKGVSEESTDEELMEACKSFESYFIEQMYKGMEKTIMKDESEKENDYLANFKDILYQEYAQSAVDKEEFGIARLLYDSMKRA